METKSISAEIIIVTPDMAQEWLSKNCDHNRTIKTKTVYSYARDMKNGNWYLTHRGIAFDKDGHLIDGQHRLRAIVLAGVPVKMVVMRDVPKESMGFVDIGVTRSTVDMLKMRYDEKYITNTTSVAAAKFMMCGWKNFSKKFTNAEIEKYIIELLDAIQWIYACSNRTGGKGKVRPVRNIKTSAFLCAMLAARLNGVPDSVITDFLDLIARNNIPLTEYNVKAALTCRDEIEAITFRGGEAMAEISDRAKKGLFLFYNNRKTLPKGFANLYPVTDTMVRDFKFDGKMAAD